MKGSRGITLVALIITIIVLLILAIVAISAVSGDGILQHAKSSADQYNAAQINENTILQNYLAYINKHNPNGETTNPPEEVNPEPVSIVGTYGDNTTTKGQRWYTFNENGTGEYGYYDDGEKSVVTSNFTYSASSDGIVTLTFTSNNSLITISEALQKSPKPKSLTITSNLESST